ncbi:hypothetical protein LCGC14_0129350 [marine sediment metagenome]|uniref:Uncharacterized protein n=1 Tax=marine sediment metagenome TaxID=412755 RepID=A0A0F9Y6B3_9ZZZZ|nr:hypothetical protein [Maribacter sp.]HDZ06097.1 hypothetical protein [Maribacter sp.]
MKAFFYLIMLLTIVCSHAQNSQDNIVYESTIDDKNVVIKLSTVDQATMLSMLHGGFYVYFDMKGKKKKNVSIQYPINATPPQRPDKNDRDSNREDRDEEAQKGPDIAVLIEKLPKTAAYVNFDSEQEFHLDLNNLGVMISYSFDQEAKELSYTLMIPKHNLLSGKSSDLSKLSIGVVSPKVKTEAKNEGSGISFGGRSQGGGPGGSGGGPGGQGGGSGGGGRGGLQNGPPNQVQRPEEVSLNFWFKAFENN